MVIENTIADAIDFVHMGALSVVVPMKIDVDVHLTVMASSLYSILARQIGNRCENQKRRSSSASFSTPPPPWTSPKGEIVVSYGRRACNPFLADAGLFGNGRKAPVAWRTGVASPRHLIKCHAETVGWESRPIQRAEFPMDLATSATR